MKRIVLSVALALFCTAAVCRPAPAASPQDPVRVGISPYSPFVISTGEASTGFSVDLWRAVARHLEWPYTFVLCSGVADKLSRLEGGDIDLAIGGITITESREVRFDFAHPVFHTGLDILVPTRSRPDLGALAASLLSGNKIRLLGIMVLLVALAGHAIWLAERRSGGKAAGFSERYWPGVFEGMYWALVTASTVGYGDKVPHRWTGRLLTCALILVFLPLFGLLVAELSSDITLVSLKAAISEPEDLEGRRVGVVAGTTSEEEMSERQVLASAFEDLEEACKALLAGRIDAVVYDAPGLLHYAKTMGKGRLRVIGKPFAPQDYGYALPNGSPHREALSRAILALMESREMASIRSKWFGGAE